MIKISLTESFGQALQNLGREVSEDAIRRVEGAVATMGEDAFQQLKVMALARLDSTAQQYISALDYQMIAPGVSVITLDPSAAHLELGYDGFDMKPGLLKNAKKRSKLGYRYRSIPFSHDKKGKEGSENRAMWSDLRQMKKLFGIDKTTSFPSGKPVLGKTAVISRDSLGSWSVKGPTIAPRRVGQMPWSKNLAGVVKYQYQTSKGNVKSHYVTFRTVSENPAAKSKWMHPGFDGIHAFQRLEEWIVNNLSKKVDEALRG